MAAIKDFVSRKFWTKRNKCLVDKFKWISISFKKMGKKGRGKGERGGDGQIRLLGELDSSVHLASQVISSPRR